MIIKKIPSVATVAAIVELAVMAANGVKSIIEIFKKKPKKKVTIEKPDSTATLTEGEI